MPTSKERIRDDGSIAVNAAFQAVKTIAAADSPYTVLATDRLILVNAVAGAVTVNLPAAASMVEESREHDLIIIKTDSGSNAVTIDGNASETINGAATHVLHKQYASAHIHTNGSNWFTEGAVQQAVIAALTDSTAGTANDALQALADGSTYANDVAAIRNNFADLAAKVNAILTALKAAGIVANA